MQRFPVGSHYTSIPYLFPSPGEVNILADCELHGRRRPLGTATWVSRWSPFVEFSGPGFDPIVTPRRGFPRSRAILDPPSPYPTNTQKNKTNISPLPQPCKATSYDQLYTWALLALTKRLNRDAHSMIRIRTIGPGRHFVTRGVVVRACMSCWVCESVVVCVHVWVVG